MNKEDITRMAQEAGFEIDCCSLEWHDRIGRFAVLVAAAEREACAARLDENAMACENPIYRSLLQANADELRGIESE